MAPKTRISNLIKRLQGELELPYSDAEKLAKYTVSGGGKQYGLRRSMGILMKSQEESPE